MMTTSSNSFTSDAVTEADLSRLAELADAMNDITRAIRLRAAKSVTAILTPTQAMIMRTVRTHPGSTATQIAEICALRLTNVSAAVRELRALGYLTARRDDADARQIRLEVTELADATLADLRRARAEQLLAVWKRTGAGTGEDLLRVGDLLARIRDGLHAEHATNVVTTAPPAAGPAASES